MFKKEKFLYEFSTSNMALLHKIFKSLEVTARGFVGWPAHCLLVGVGVCHLVPHIFLKFDCSTKCVNRLVVMICAV